MSFFRIEALPAEQGDSLWIEYGTEEAVHRLLIDAGTKATHRVLAERIRALPEGDRSFELFVVTHIDSDHIGGAVPLLRDQALGATFEDVWFNGLKHLPQSLEPLGAVEADLLTTEVQSRPWNKAWKGGAVVIPAEGDLPTHSLPGGMKLTLLSPRLEELQRLRPEWEATLKAHGLMPGIEAFAAPEVAQGLEALGPAQPLVPADIDIPQLAGSKFGRDGSLPNGTSIVLLAEFGGHSALLCADAYPWVVLESLERLLGDSTSKLEVGCFKLPHHGSKANLHLPLAERVSTDRYLISSNGSKTHHPNIEAIARVLSSAEQSPALYFNYRSQWNEVWADPSVVARCGYKPHFPPEGSGGIVVDVASA